MEYLTVKDVMEILKLGHTSAYKLFIKPGFPAFKCGNKYLVERTAFQNYLNKYIGSEIEL